jgi:hypothetical protein
VTGAIKKSLITPLHAACRWNHADIVALLVKRGADIYALNADDMNPLAFACLFDSAEAAAALLETAGERKTSIAGSCSSILGNTPLHCAGTLRACGGDDIISTHGWYLQLMQRHCEQSLFSSATASLGLVVGAQRV